ncbi:FadR family transcriptional regulator [Nocardiopsis gilva YIM 90087]|uniref:FadR family transcriptional regulator n=1 Tax=Nocardiopsis gilva YIM 90087 TaxID=1235441 RepID=A0A223SDE9_9ACTN|nr:FCD domain-containing protein [Nocardiopsis gilva]ASU86167.1 FadR family transcriptional regulator [Nocardiopsis gilva YIM 90087]
MSEPEARSTGEFGEPAADAVFRTVRAGNAFEETVERLLSAIKLGVVARGERFPPERELAGRLGVSRITLREAIRALQESGYVESRRGRFGGTFVTYVPPRPSKAEAQRLLARMDGSLDDLFVFREALEVGAAVRLAGVGLTAEQEELLLTRLAEVDAASTDDYRRCDTVFHLTLAELTGSPSLSSALADTRMRINDLLNAMPILARNLEHSSRQHRAIVDAIRAREPDTARRAVAEHLDGTAALLRAFLG